MNGGFVARLFVGVALALAAGVANFLWLKGQAKTDVDSVSASFQPVEFLYYNADAKIGEPIQCGVVKLGLPKDAESPSIVHDNFFSGADHAAVNGRIATRARKANELVSRSDLYVSASPNLPAPKSCLLGPFRVRKINGSRMTIEVDYRQEAGRADAGYFDSKVDRLLQIAARGSNDPNLSILSVVSYPNSAVSQRQGANVGNAQKKIAITVQIPANLDLSEVMERLKQVNSVSLAPYAESKEDDDGISGEVKTGEVKTGEATKTSDSKKDADSEQDFVYVGFVVPTAALTEDEKNDSFSATSVQ